MYKLKNVVADHYRRDYGKILKDILRSPVLHIDETSVNLLKDKGYVWVLASPDAAYFFYRESREGAFLAEMLKSFKGVLVSDFYTAYDLINTPQQRCLIHLMRDMNEDLLKNPFDDEFKSIAERFSRLLRRVVHTIDRYGLKRRHLQKHKSEWVAFSRWLLERDFDSRAAIRYKKRIVKYENMLFAFLDYDGVPWNNSNAEHAIKSFAKYRRFTNGIMSESSLCDYLVILSLYKTCDYRGVDFLRVLLSCEDEEDGNFGTRKRLSLHQRTQIIVALGRRLPWMVERLQGVLREGMKIKAAFAPNLWPVKINPNELERVLFNIASGLMDMATQGCRMTFAARNARFWKKDLPSGLCGAYVTVSVSCNRIVDAADDRSPVLCEKEDRPDMDPRFKEAREFANQSGGVAIAERAPGRRTVRLYIAKCEELTARSSGRDGRSSPQRRAKNSAHPS